MIKRGKVWVLRDKISRFLRGKDRIEGKVKITLVSNLAVHMDNNAITIRRSKAKGWDW